MPPPFFSIIIPVFQARPELERTLASIAAQDFGDFECLVMDGGSSDGTVQYAGFQARADARVRLFSEPDRGIYDAMNKGIHRSQGRYLHFLGAGDRLTEGILRKVAECLQREAPEQVVLLYGDVYWESQSRVHCGPVTRFSLPQVNLCHQSVFYDRRIFLRLGDYEIEYPLCADWVFNLRCFGDASIAKRRLDEIVARYDGAGESSRRRDELFDRRRLALVRRHLGLLPFLYAAGLRVDQALGGPMAFLKRQVRGQPSSSA